MLKDSYGRGINYVRIALTDRCNLRCQYCMPSSGVRFKPHEEILSFEQIYLLIDILRNLGFSKFRFTGGEPLLRKNAMDFFENIKLEKFYITTNLAVKELDMSRLNRLPLGGINVSLDTLDPEKFRKMTGGGDIMLVLRRLRELSIRPLKLNTVLIKNFNEDEVERLITFAAELGASIRFIEKMELTKNELGFVPLGGVISALIKKGLITAPLKAQNNSAAKYYGSATGANSVGFITPVSRPFCGGCSRIRIFADGGIKLCLYSKKVFNIRGILGGKSGEKLAEECIKNLLNEKPFNSSEAKQEYAEVRAKAEAL